MQAFRIDKAAPAPRVIGATLQMIMPAAGLAVAADILFWTYLHGDLGLAAVLVDLLLHAFSLAPLLVLLNILFRRFWRFAGFFTAYALCILTIWTVLAILPGQGAHGIRFHNFHIGIVYGSAYFLAFWELLKRANPELIEPGRRIRSTWIAASMVAGVVLAWMVLYANTWAPESLK